MTSLHIVDVKDFMSKLLLSDIFNRFLLSEAEITTFASFSIDGKLNKDFFSEDELIQSNLENMNYSYWETLKPFCFEIIKGKKTPAGFKIVFMLSPSNVERLLLKSSIPIRHEDINGLFLNIKYTANSLSCITGTSLKIFTLDKTLENEWDLMVQKFFKAHEIPFEVL